MEEIYEGGHFQRREFVFRGQADADWELQSTYDRLGYDPTEFQALLDAFKHECESLDIDLRLLEDDEFLIPFGQHHGLPTRLLDWSESPYISCFFAFSEHLRGNIDSQFVALWVLRVNSPVWSIENGVEIIWPSFTQNPRLRNQGGCFTLLNSQHRSVDAYVDTVSHVADSFCLRKCILPAHQCHIALADLAAMGISPSHLFPGPDGCAATAVYGWREYLERSNSP